METHEGICALKNKKKETQRNVTKPNETRNRNVNENTLREITKCRQTD